MKRGMFFGVLILIIISLSFVAAQNQTTDSEKLDKAYSCLNDKIGGCSGLSTEGQIFSLLATGKCESEVLADSNYMSDTDIKDTDIKKTAQAALALDNAGISTSDAESWLLEQKETPSELNWYLQIDTSASEGTTCTINYDSTEGTVTVNEDKTVSGAESMVCLSPSGAGISNKYYWLNIINSDSNCYNNNFSISCDESFSTNLLYKKTNDDTIYVSGKTSSASPEGTVVEEVNSFCFGDGSCDYEASLWAALVLDSLGNDVSSYLPYLITMADDSSNKQYLPEAFLCALTDDYCSELLNLQKQVNEQYYWEKSGDKYYDTALALMPFQYENPVEKTNSIDWLLSDGVQTSEGCWDNNNVRNTAFLLYSIDPRIISPDVEGVDCEDAGYYCMSSMSCNEVEGNVLNEYFCTGTYVCCSEEKTLETCSAQGGEVCDSDQECSDGTTIDVSDLKYGQVCCIGGTCEDVEEEPEISDCELIGGTCRVSQCLDDEEESAKECSISTDICCVKKTKKGGYIWIIILGILIVLVVLGIVFKDKLRPLWFKLKSKFGKGKGKGKSGPSRPGPRPPPGFPSQPQRRPVPRKIIPGQKPPQRGPPTKPKSSEEFNSVLKKLKEIGK